MKTLKELQNECIAIFGMEHSNTVAFFEYCSRWEGLFDTSYLAEKLEEMKMYHKINTNKVTHAIVQVDGGRVVVVELVNKEYDFYASAFVDIFFAIKDKYKNMEFIKVLDIIAE